MQHLESATREKQRSLADDVFEKQMAISSQQGKIAECESRLQSALTECAEQGEIIESLRNEYKETKTQVQV